MDGSDGAAATIQVGTVTTGNAGTNASVTNSGTSSAAVFDFTIPRGQTGATGSRGTGVYPISVQPYAQSGFFGPYQIDYSDSPSSARPPINGDLYLYGSDLYKVTGIMYDQDNNPLAVILDNPISIAPSGGNTKGYIAVGENYQLEWTTNTVYSNNFATTFTPNHPIIKTGDTSYIDYVEVEVSKTVEDPILKIKQAGRKYNYSGANWQPNSSVVIYDATDGTNTLSQYACYDLSCRFSNNSNFVWDSDLADIKTALLSGTTYKVLLEFNLIPGMTFGSYDVKTFYIASGTGTISYDSNADEFVIEISSTDIFKPIAGTLANYSTYK